MKSKLILQFNDFLSSFSNTPKSGDWLGILLVHPDPNVANITIHEAPTVNRDVKGAFIGSTPSNMVAKFHQDWRDTGGTSNVKFTYISATNRMEVELQNELWTFGDLFGSGEAILGQAADNGKITQISLVNSANSQPKTVSATLTGLHACVNNRLNYVVNITGGIAPYTVQGTIGGDLQSSDGSANVVLTRGVPVTIRVLDSTGTEIGTTSLSPPIPLHPSLFNIRVSQLGNSPLAEVSENVNLPSEIYPISYSLDGTNYGSSGNFPDLSFEQNYTVYVRDGFGCSITKTFVTNEDLSGQTEPETETRIAYVSNAGTLIMAECVMLDTKTKRNYSNTLSKGENVNFPYQYIQEFDPTDLIVQQFKSSYNFNRVLIWNKGAVAEIVPTLQSQNMRLVEKVDCKLFRDSDGKMGIYFRNGNSYVQGTTTANGASDYSEVNLPSWAEADQIIDIDGIGLVRIERISRDSERGLYVKTNTSYGSLIDDDGIVQANYNAQNYNTYEFGFFMSAMPDEFQVIIEFGYNDQVERTFKSELIRRVNDDCKKSILVWSDPENKAGIVHQTGIVHYARLNLRITPKTNSESSTYRGDNETFSLSQSVYRTVDVRAMVQGHLMENKLHLAFGMDDFYLNGIVYRKSKMESEPIEGTNYYEIRATLETGGNELDTNKSELVLKDPLTEIGSVIVIPDPVPSLLGTGNGGFVLNGSGGGIIVDD